MSLFTIEQMANYSPTTIFADMNTGDEKDKYILKTENTPLLVFPTANIFESVLKTSLTSVDENIDVHKNPEFNTYLDQVLCL